MAAPFIINKYYASFRGLDVRANDLTRSQAHASDMLNATYTKTGAIVKRSGIQAKTESVGGAGLSTYSDVNLTTGAVTSKLVAIDDNFHVLTEQTIDVTYSGGDLAYGSIYLNKDDGLFYLDIFEGSVQVLNLSLGTGLEDASPVTINNVLTNINGLANFAATATGNVSSPACFANLSDSIEFPASFTYYQWEQANSPSVSPLGNFWAKKDTLEFENASMVNLNNNMYVSTGWDDLHKYDGQNFYRAGMPSGDIPTSVLAGAGVITNSSLDYIITYIQKDNKGNIIEGVESDESISLNASANTVEVTVNNILAASGFNTNCAIVVGAQVGVNTITVDDGSAGTHTMLAGDTAYFFDSLSSTYIEREILSVTASDITIDGAAVNVADNAVISNNLKIGLWRNQSAGTTFALVAELPNNSFASTQVYSDNKTDGSLGAEYIFPIKPHNLPPKGRYSTAFRTNLIITGQIESPNEVFYSDIDSPEYFPEADNAFNVDTEFGDVITGIAGNNQSLFVFKQRSIHQVSGELNEDVFRLDRVNAGEIGCEAHHSIKEVEGVLFFLASDGVYAIASNEISPKEISVNIEPRFTPRNISYNKKQAVAVNWLEGDKYILFMPEVEVTAGSTYATGNSKTLVFDYYHGAWLDWGSLNMHGGLTIFNGKMWLTKRQNSSIPSGVVYNSYFVKETGSIQDYSDHNLTIDFNYKTHWESLGEPSVFKKYLRLKVFSLDSVPDGIDNGGFDLDINGENSYVPNSIFSLTQDFTGGSGDNGWGIGSWGLEPWGSSKIQEIVSKLGKTKARSLRLTFSNSNLLESVYISGWELEVATPFKISIKE